MQSISFKLLKQLPKVELHCHLDGSLRTKSIIDQAEKDEIKLPSHELDTLDKHLRIGKNRGTLEEYIQRFDITLSVMQTPESLQRFAYELIEDVAKENVRYIEVRYSPILHTQKGMTLDTALESVQKGLKKGERIFYLSPRGKKFNQKIAKELSKERAKGAPPSSTGLIPKKR